MSVYFAQVGRYIKVGYSANPERRVRNLFKSTTRYGAPRDIDGKTPRKLLGHVPGELSEEHAAHAALADFRVMGEWFLDEPEVRDYIQRCLAADAVSEVHAFRPAGPYRWLDDPILHNDEDREADRRAAEAMSTVLARYTNTA